MLEISGLPEVKVARVSVVVSPTAVGLRNYLTYFFVYSARCRARLRAGWDGPGDTSGARAGEE